jgi:hypothetical protein
MALENMASRLTGYFPRMPKSEAYNIVNDAWTDIRTDRLWSFQLVEDSIATPNVINVGTFTTVQGTNTVTADASASVVIAGLTNPFITLRQFRITSGGIYSIVAADFTVPTAVVLTLDRIYTDPSANSQPYQIYQCYFAAPVPDFKRWIDWRDLTNGDWLSIYNTRREINMGDPQRLYFTFPHWVLPFGQDLRPGSSTLGYPLSELYPNPLSYVSYMRWWIRSGADLINPQDTLPYPMQEDLVFARSRMKACEIAEYTRDPSVPRGQSADYKFIYGAAKSEYDTLLKKVGFKDRDITDIFLSRIRRDGTTGLNRLAYYSSLSGRAYMGG